MKKKILCLSSAIYIFLYSTIYCFCVPVYATVPGVVEASIIWEGWETLSLILGVTVDFNENLTISKNNDIQYEYYYNKIINDNSLSSSEQAELIAQLDQTRNGFLDNIVDVGSTLWYYLTRWTYSDKIESSPFLYNLLNNNVKNYFDNYSGNCAIYATLADNGSSSAIVIFGNGAMSSPRDGGYNWDGSWRMWYIVNDFNCTYLYNNSSSGTPFNVYGDSLGLWFVGSSISVQYFENKAKNQVIVQNNNDNSLVGSPSWQDYIDGITGNFSIVDGSLIDMNTGEAPIVLDGEVLDDAISGIQDGTMTYDQAIDQAFENTDTGEITDYPSPISKKALDELIAGLNLTRLQTKFPFCIPHDIQLIYSGATAVSSNAPVIIIPMHLEFKNHVYYDNDEAIVIDFSDFDGIINIFREGFFLLFLVGLLWVSIEILQAFFVVTE